MPVNSIAWNVKAQRVNVKANNASVINSFLDSFHSKVFDAYTKLFIGEEHICSS